jgi:transcriptional antiterminator RfaH
VVGPVPDTQRWYLINAHTGREQLALAHLARQDYRTFLPVMWRSIRHARQIRSTKAAFFPGYLFVQLDLSRDCWRPIDGTVGVVRLIKAGERPLPAPEGLVESLIATTDAEGVLDFSACFKVGDRVRIVHGPFVDQLALVESAGGGERVRVLLSIMNQIVPVEVSSSHLAPV